MNEEEGEEDEEGRGGDARKEDCGAAQIWAKGGALIKRGGQQCKGDYIHYPTAQTGTNNTEAA